MCQQQLIHEPATLDGPGCTQLAETSTDDLVQRNVETATRFLTSLFAENQLVLFRPIETWTEAGRKRSRVDYHRTCYRAAVPDLLKLTILDQIQSAEEQRVNLFFGVCPRLGDKGRFDLAWQIRTVRAMWTDIDHVTVNEALERVAKAGLPRPSIVVNSGNGAHLYWLLDQAYLIDDVGEPPPVLTEWIASPEGRKKPRRYLLEGEERIYLDQRRHVSRLSAKAESVQNILAGIAKACGGDHTTDLSRLLRLPGTLNRKDQRNGRKPVPTVLVECESSRRYPLALFEPFTSTSPESERAKQIAAMPLPRSRRASASKLDKLNELVAASSIAPAGTRSEADFGVCCFAIRSGVAKEEVWSQVEGIGKFAEKGRRYFDVTWENAEYDVRVGIHDKLQKKQKLQPAPSPHDEASSDGQSDGPAELDDDSDGIERPTIQVATQTTPVGATMGRITDHLLAAGNCFSRADQLVVVNNEAISPILSTPELGGLLNHYVEFYFIGDETGEYKPLPLAYGNTWLNHPGERARLPAIKLFSRNPVYTDDWRLVAPGYDSVSGIYYAGLPAERRDGTTHLDRLLKDFCFKSVADRTNYLGMLLTTLLVPRFIGSKPAVLFNGNQPELGKSILAQIIAILRDGHPVETASYNANDEEFEKRLGSIVRRGVTTIIIDNAKSRGREARIDSACLERSITDSILSFRLLGYSQDIRAENSHIFCLTANSANVSRDLVTRSAVINLFYEGNPERRSFSIADPEGYAQEHRLELYGELIGMVERWKEAGQPLASVDSRFNKRGWGKVIGGILDACGEPDFLSNAEEAATQLDDTRREFTELVAIMGDHPQGIWTAAELSDLCVRHELLQIERGDGSARSQATRMGVIAGRYVSEHFSLSDGRAAIFHRTEDRKGKLYKVEITDQVPNV
jgi:hypothetical protein